MSLNQRLQLSREQQTQVSSGHDVLQGGEVSAEENLQTGYVTSLSVYDLTDDHVATLCKGEACVYMY